MPLSMPPKRSYRGCELEPKIVVSQLSEAKILAGGPAISTKSA